MSTFPVGAKVRAKSPEDFISEVASKLRNRTGVVIKHQDYSGRAVVKFDAIGRRKEYVWVAYDRDMESAE